MSVMLYKENLDLSLELLEESGKWGSQTKVDGDHFEIPIKNGEVKLINRHGNDYTKQFPEITPHIRTDLNAVLNGEIAYWDSEQGRFNFNKFRSRQGLQNDKKIAIRSKTLPCQLYIFDLIELEGVSMKNNPEYPFKRRHELLRSLIKDNENVKLLPIRTDLQAHFKEECSRNAEGIMVKRLDNIYCEGRTNTMLKWKNWTYTNIKFTGCEINPAGITLTNPEGDRVLVAGKKSALVRATIIESGYSYETIRHLQTRTENGRLREPTHKKHIGALIK